MPKLIRLGSLREIAERLDMGGNTNVVKRALRQNASVLRVAAAAMASSVSFFLLSNFAVWAAWNMYPKTFDGLMTSYVLGLPFFRQGVQGDLLFTGLFFATPILMRALSGKPAISEAV